MSGGVDSSVASALLIERGYEVHGCFMRLSGVTSGNHDEAGRSHDDRTHHILNQLSGSCSLYDPADAKHVADHLGIPLHVLDFQDDFSRVLDYFISEYHAGRTPNPCVRCNVWMKFGRMWDFARSIGANRLATGHHARVEQSGTTFRLLRGSDPDKDQSYVLFGCPLERLGHILLPVGNYRKEEIRRMAGDRNLPVHDKPDSQELCFIPQSDYVSLLKSHSPGAFQEGRIIDTTGREVGRHDGHQQFTIGQRRGVNVAMGYPVYVVNKDAESNTVVVGTRAELMADGCRADQVNWLVDPTRDWRPCLAKVRYNQQPVDARVRSTGRDTLEVLFDSPVAAVTPGQAVVCYEDDRLIGGGWIKEPLRRD